jgi:hypothetical protein
VDHTARPEALAKLGVLRIVGLLRLLLGVQVIEVAVKLVETVRGRQVFVTVAQMVLPELAGGVSLGLEQGGDGRVLGAQPFLKIIPSLATRSMLGVR